MPSGGSHFLLFLVQVGVLLSLALLFGRAAVRLGLPALVGELLAGVLLGPTVLGHAAPQLAGLLFPAGQTQLLDAFGQIGVLLLVGVTGAQLDPGLLRDRGAAAVRISLAGLLVPLALGVATGYLLPGEVVAPGTSREVFAVFLGVAMCVTALPVIAKTLSDLNLLHRRISQFIVTAALFDDAVGWLLLSVVSAMAAGRAHAGGVAATVAYTAAFLAAAVLVCRPLARRALPAVTRDTGSSIATAVSVVLFSAAITGAMGMEALFGAFIAGAAILTLMDPVRLAPLRAIVMSVFAPVFLAGIGLRLDLTALARPQILLVGILLLLVATAGKFAGAYLGARSARLGHWEALALGAGMNSRGMVEVIIAATGLALGVLDTAMFTVIVFVAVVTSLTAPPLLRAAVRRLPADEEERAREERQAAWHAVG
ncbi:cation:proton antiporter [Planomonospora sp. ID91781]|uniref:Sodium/hydrogen exchanger n=1 Tax=Planomonospora sphaerica TaxID=161355 RepID=A0A161LKA5_9ACTN|nr:MULTISPECIES: cation:proton antiporter [Planomonospora]MBG0823421.1 cation:proton antiporter [Planomonospora sp. ID91781]GAT67115.1 sodium/hydrogen exchanger [Planomonospora sphaerica]